MKFIKKIEIKGIPCKSCKEQVLFSYKGLNNNMIKTFKKFLSEKDTKLVKLTNLDIFNGDLKNIVITSIRFNRSFLCNVTFKNVIFINCSFERCIFSKCDFENCNFIDCNFYRNDITQCKGDWSFKITEITHTNISMCNMRFHLKFSEMRANEINHSHIQLYGDEESNILGSSVNYSLIETDSNRYTNFTTEESVVRLEK